MATSKADANKFLDELKNLQKGRRTIEDTVTSILKPVLSKDELATSQTHNVEKLTPQDMEKCYNPLVDAFSSKCIDMGCNFYTSQVVGHFVKACTGPQKTDGSYPAFERVLQSMESNCDIAVRNSLCGVD